MDAVQAFSADLVAVLVAVTAGEPLILTIQGGRTLPSGPFEPGHRSLHSGLRAWVEQQTRHPLGYVEQLYTFADGDRAWDGAVRAISVSYLALTRKGRVPGGHEEGWHGWYRYFPWEDHRAGPPRVIADTIAPRLQQWAGEAGDCAGRWQRAAVTFGLDGRAWNEELVEETGAMEAGTGGRPAKLFRFRREVLAERAAAGTKLSITRP